MVLSCNSQSNNSKSELNIYSDTPVQSLAIAIDLEDTISIKKIIEENPKFVLFPKGYKDEYSHFPSLLIWSLNNKKYDAFEILLNKGSDANFLTVKKKTPLMYASDYVGGGNVIDIKYIKMLIDKGADASYVRQGFIDEKRHTIRGESPLIISFQTGNLELVKLLIDNGAKYNSIAYTPRSNGIVSQSSALRAALSFNRIEISKYLIIDKKTDINRSFGKTGNGEEITINYFLRIQLYLRDSQRYAIKQEIIKFIEENGIDYRSSPIPERAINYAKATYPDSWEQYLDEY